MKFSKLATLAASSAALGLAALSQSVVAGGGNAEQIRVEARMDAGADLAQAKVEYRDRFRNGLLEQRFSAEAEDFKPGTELVVTVNGATVGTMFVNDLGVAELQLRTAEFIDDPGDGTPIDSDFPRLMPGDTATVGSLSGVFVED